jgi:hypothetical protein
MGEKLVRIFEIVQEQSGLKGRMELATRSGISLNRATQIKDTEELVKRMKDIASSILMNIQKLNVCMDILKKDLGEGFVASCILTTEDGQVLVATDQANIAEATLLNDATALIRNALKTYPAELGQYYYIDVAGNMAILVIPFGDYQWTITVNKKLVKLGLLLNVVLPAIINAFEDAVVS